MHSSGSKLMVEPYALEPLGSEIVSQIRLMINSKNDLNMCYMVYGIS